MARNRRFDPTVNYYSVLNVSQNASREEITRTYRSLMRNTHPDNFSNPAEREKAEERSKSINAAYAVLSRPDIRKEYDSAIRRSVMASTVMERYSTPSASQSRISRERPSRPPPPPPQNTRSQQTAYTGAVLQLVITFAGVTLGLIILIVLGSVAMEGLQLLFQ